MTSDSKLKIGIISGSHRPDSQSERVAQYFAQRLKCDGIQTEVLSLGKTHLPLWQDDNKRTPTEHSLWKHTSIMLKSCQGFVVISPEWGGMAAPALKNLFLYCRDREMNHKPGLLVSISASINGAYPISDLRVSSYKNTKIVYLPEHLILRHVEKILNHDASKNDEHQHHYMRDRIENGLKMLIEYTKVMTPLRQSSFYEIDCQQYGNGM